MLSRHAKSSLCLAGACGCGVVWHGQPPSRRRRKKGVDRDPGIDRPAPRCHLWFGFIPGDCVAGAAVVSGSCCGGLQELALQREN